jgi:hypothetical protein
VPTYANKNRFCCPTNHCPNAYYSFAKEQWDTRPIEDALCKELEEWKMDAERLFKALVNGQLMFVNIEVSSDIKYAAAINDAIEAHRELVEKKKGMV